MLPELEKHTVWCYENSDRAVFRCTVSLEKSPMYAETYIFADSFYSLFINGEAVTYGPARFDPKCPEYDTIDIAAYLIPGKNVIAALVYGNISNGTHMQNPPAFIFLCPALHIASENFVACGETEYLAPVICWGRICDNVDSRICADSLGIDFDDSGWKSAKYITYEHRGALSPRSLLMLRRERVYEHSAAQLPFTGKKLTIEMQKNVMVHIAFEFQAEAGVTLDIDGNRYIGDGKRRRFFTSNAVTSYNRHITINSDGEFTLYRLDMYTYTYPWDIAGSFNCKDNILTGYWRQCVYTLLQTCRDGYISDGEEQCEWSADSLMVEYPLTKAAVVSPDGKYSDPALLRKTIFDIAQSQAENGMLKAHHPSDRFDIHAYIEDYCCIWVEALAQYYEATLDIAFVGEMRVVLEKQLDALLRLIGGDGLACAREFIIFDNPLKYKVCRGATVNCFVYMALRRGAYLLRLLGSDKAEEYDKAAVRLCDNINDMLYDGENGTYFASYEDHDTKSFHAPLIALYCGVAEGERRSAVLSYISANVKEAGEALWPYTHHYLLSALYERDTYEDDCAAIAVIKSSFKQNFESVNPGYVTYERFGDGSRQFHCFGIVPAYFCSAYILGVRRIGEISDKLIKIEPHLGELNESWGAAVTEFGVVHVMWRVSCSAFGFHIEVPQGAVADIALPFDISGDKTPRVEINGNAADFIRSGRRVSFRLESGSYDGAMRFE